jgi:hypothetical protein
VSGGEYCNVCENFPCLGNHPPGEVSEDDAFAERLREQTLKVFGLKPWDITATVRPPRRVRLWRAVTFARRRGKVVDWGPYEAAEAEAREADEAFAAGLPGRLAEIAGQLGKELPDGLRFEWTAEGEQADGG